MANTSDEMKRDYDVIIVGGGIVGTALLYTLANYTGIKSVLLLDKRDGAGQLNSNSRCNSQTLHFGDIETNYSIKKAEEVKFAANILLNYMSRLGRGEAMSVFSRVPKMVLGVGSEEVEALKKRYSGRLMHLFPDIATLDRKGISKVEPYVVKGRDRSEEIFAARSPNGYMVDYGRLSRTFVSGSTGGKKRGVRVDVAFGEKLLGIGPQEDGHILSTASRTYSTRFAVVAAGTHTLYFAKRLGYGSNLSTIAVRGNFYHSRKVLNGKVYMVQMGKIPFLATHGDPDINHPERTRFGPTITLYPYLEKDSPGSMLEYASSVGLDYDAVLSYSGIAGNRELSSLLLRNLSYSLPMVGKANFVREEVKKIVPLLGERDVEIEADGGGIRPQIIDKGKREISLGEGKISGNGIIFNIAPSPGASSCMKTALDDAASIARHLDAGFDRERFYSDYITRKEKS